MKKMLSLVLVFFLSITLTGCNMQNLLGGLLGSREKTTSKSSPQDDKKIIAVAIDDENPNKDMFLLGIREMAAKEELEIKVLSKEEQMDTEALKEAKVLIVQDGEQALLKGAEKEKIPIIALNELPSGIKAQGVILPDPEQVGKLMAQQILPKVSAGEVVFLMGEADNPVSQLILSSLKRELSSNGQLTVHSISNPPESESLAIQTLAEHLQKNAGKVKAICAKNEKLLSQTYDLLKSMKLSETVYLVGGEATPNSLQRIASGSQVADIDTAPYIQGINAFQWDQKLLNKEAVDITQSITSDQGEVAAKLIPAKTVTTENIALLQKSYTQAATTLKELEKKAESQAKDSQGQEKGKSSSDQEGKEQGEEKSGQGNGESKGQGKGQSDGQGSSQGSEQGDGQGDDQGSGQSGGQMVIPEGVAKVTEKIHTEITREYLDENGKILGTEKSANDQVRTIPPEMLLKEQQQQQQKQQQKEGQEQQEEGKEKASGEGGENA